MDNLREDIQEKFKQFAVDVLEARDQIDELEDNQKDLAIKLFFDKHLDIRADQILALILKKLPEKMTYKSEKGYDELDRGRYFGFNECLSEVRSILESPPPDPTNEELSKLTLEDLT